MKFFKRVLSIFALVFSIAFVGCSSETSYVVEEERPLGAEYNRPQKQTETKAQDEYSDEDWFYDYYDLTEEEKDKLEEQ